MKPRKLLALALTFALTATIAVPALAEDILSGGTTAAPRFNDTQGHWAEEIIDRWGGYGVVQGDQNGSFNPDQPITRGSMATVMVNLLGLSEKPAENPYGDLNGSEWYADAVLKCTAAGVMQGDGSNCNAGANITRQEATVMFARALGVEADASPDLSKFSDGGDVAAWAAGAVSAMADRGIITGAGDGRVQPTQNIDRASTMAILDKAISTYIVSSGSYEAKDSGITLVRTGGVTISGSAQDILIAPGAAGGTVTLDDVSVSGIITINADGVTLSGTASVDEVVVNGDNCSVTLPGKTTVRVAEGVTGTKVCGKDVAGGTSTVIQGSTGGSGGNGGYVPPADPVTQHGTWKDALEDSSVPDEVKQYIRYAYLDEYQGVNFKVVPNVIPVGDGFNTSIFDAERNLWIGTDTGILILSQDGETTSVITADNTDEGYLKYNRVTMLFSDGGSGAWVLCGNPETEENAVCHIAEVN